MSQCWSLIIKKIKIEDIFDVFLNLSSKFSYEYIGAFLLKFILKALPPFDLICSLIVQNDHLGQKQK